MATRYTGKPCSDCGKSKGPKQADLMRCYSCQRTANRKAKDQRHGAHVETTYGITAEQYRALYAYQSGTCAICCRARGATKRLAVDHDHKCAEGHAKTVGCPKCVRGLLCSTCNTFIGRMRDDPAVGDRMASYLRTPPFQALVDSRPLRVARDH